MGSWLFQMCSWATPVFPEWGFRQANPPCHEAFAALSTCWEEYYVNKGTEREREWKKKPQKTKQGEKWWLWELRWSAVWFFFRRCVLEGLPQDVSCAAWWWVESVCLQLDVSSRGNSIAAKRGSTRCHGSWGCSWSSTHPHGCHRDAELPPSCATAAAGMINLAATNLSGVVSSCVLHCRVQRPAGAAGKEPN